MRGSLTQPIGYKHDQDDDRAENVSDNDSDEKPEPKATGTNVVTLVTPLQKPKKTRLETIWSQASAEKSAITSKTSKDETNNNSGLRRLEPSGS